MVSPPPPPATFFSALDIVFSDDENGQEIAKDESRDVTPTQPDQQLSTANSNSAQNAKGPAPAGGRMRAAAPTGGRMSVRASKATALAAMQANAKAAAQPSPLAEVAAQATPPPPTEAKIEPKEEEIVGPHPSKNSIRRAVRLPTAPPLDFSTIRMAAPRHPNPPPREKPRMFELEEAPVYHPSIEEFSQPMEYIEKIAKDAKQYGICKIVPPEGWRPPFAIDTEVSRSFKVGFDAVLTAFARASDVPLQDSLAAAQLARSLGASQSQLPRAALSLPSPTGEQRHYDPEHRRQAGRHVEAEARGRYSWRLPGRES